MTLSRSEIEDRARARFGEPNRGLSSRHELRFGRHGSIAVQLTGEKAGCWYDFEALDGHTLLDKDELPRRDLCAARARFEHSTKSGDKLPRVLANLRPVHSTAAELYLLRRGITAWPPHSIRFCQSPQGLCGIAQALDGGAVKAVQIVYLTHDGRKRPSPYDGVVKRTYTDCTNWHEISAVRLPGKGEPILCEGIETGLSIWGSLEPRRPIHVCLGLAGVQALRLNSKRITIARDADEPASPADKAIAKAVDARERRGQRVRIACPPRGMDFNDVLRRCGAEEVARIIRHG